MRHIADAERRARLARRHRLHPDHRTNDVAQITDDLVAIHSSDPTTVFLTTATRMRDPEVAAIEDALYRTRTVLRHHAMRRTMWVMTPQTTQRAHASSTRKILRTEIRKALGWLEAALPGENAAEWFEAATERVVQVVREGGVMTTRDVGKALPDIAAVKLVAGAGTRNTVSVSAHSRLLMLAAFDGRLVRTSPVGTWTSSQYRWAPIEDWHVTDLDALDAKTASAGLVDQYLRRYGPVTEDDIVWWSGWTKTQTRHALERVDAVEVSLDSGATGWISAADEDEAEPVRWVALLPGLDATTMGWKQRSFYLADELVPRLFDRFMNAGPTVWLDGHIVGGWAQRPDGEIALDLPDGFPADRRPELEAEIERLEGFIDDIRFKLRFPSPNQKELRA